MMSRLYPSTRILYGQVHAILVMLSVNPLFTPTQFGLLCLYVTGLILLDGKQTNTRITGICPLVVTMRSIVCCESCPFRHAPCWACVPLSSSDWAYRAI